MTTQHSLPKAKYLGKHMYTEPRQSLGIMRSCVMDAEAAFHHALPPYVASSQSCSTLREVLCAGSL